MKWFILVLAMSSFLSINTFAQQVAPAAPAAPAASAPAPAVAPACPPCPEQKAAASAKKGKSKKVAKTEAKPVLTPLPEPLAEPALQVKTAPVAGPTLIQPITVRTKAASLDQDKPLDINTVNGDAILAPVSLNVRNDVLPADVTVIKEDRSLWPYVGAVLGTVAVGLAVVYAADEHGLFDRTNTVTHR